MSVTTELRDVTVRRPVTVYRCDGPACTNTHEVAPDPVHVQVPVWVTVIDPNRPPQHYCSRDCLADAVVP